MAVLRPAGDFDTSYRQDMALIRRPWHWLLIIGLIGTMAVAPFSGSAYIVNTLNQIAYTVIAIQGLNLLTGYTGQISLGQAAFMLAGGYASALLVINLGLSFFIALPVAALTTGLVGSIFGLPSLRVKGFYLAMATLAAQFIIPWLTRHTFKDYMGGAAGQISVPVPVLGPVIFDETWKFFYISLFVLVITTVMAFNISRSRLGRAFVAVRDNDLAAELYGVNLFGYKLRAFFLAALFAGIAGALRAHSDRTVGTELGYGLNESIFFLGMLIIGGLGTNLGPFLGATVVILLDDASAWFGSFIAGLFPAYASNVLTSFRPIFFGLVLMLFLIFEPRGLAYRWMLIKAAWRLLPFSR
jgi:branched-chain amino acid transport system permease protein